MADLEHQMKDYRLTTAKILYHMPDCKELLQEFIWQDYDIAPAYPELHQFLDFWERKIEGALHSVYIARKKLISHDGYRFANHQKTIH